ncbi:hypothetical protein [Parasphingorhabdus sp.]|uniref:hypothetical protein n=1 Tax=Parasphingorhabdus sp. TaxID=2709688 RepID=UPI003A8E5482
MAKGILMSRINANPGHEDAFLNWYKTEFTPFITSLPGFVSARVMRFKRPARPGDGSSPNEFGFLTIYELEADDLEEPIRHLNEAVAAGGENQKIMKVVSFDPVPTEWLYEDIFITA